MCVILWQYTFRGNVLFSVMRARRHGCVSVFLSCPLDSSTLYAWAGRLQIWLHRNEYACEACMLNWFSSSFLINNLRDFAQPKLSHFPLARNCEIILRALHLLWQVSVLRLGLSWIYMCTNEKEKQRGSTHTWPMPLVWVWILNAVRTIFNGVLSHCARFVFTLHSSVNTFYANFIFHSEDYLRALNAIHWKIEFPNLSYIIQFASHYMVLFAFFSHLAVN